MLSWIISAGAALIGWIRTRPAAWLMDYDSCDHGSPRCDACWGDEQI